MTAVIFATTAVIFRYDRTATTVIFFLSATTASRHAPPTRLSSNHPQPTVERHVALQTASQVKAGMRRRHACRDALTRLAASSLPVSHTEGHALTLDTGDAHRL